MLKNEINKLFVAAVVCLVANGSCRVVGGDAGPRDDEGEDEDSCKN